MFTSHGREIVAFCRPLQATPTSMPFEQNKSNELWENCDTSKMFNEFVIFFFFFFSLKQNNARSFKNFPMELPLHLARKYSSFTLSQEWMVWPWGLDRKESLAYSWNRESSAASSHLTHVPHGIRRAGPIKAVLTCSTDEWIIPLKAISNNKSKQIKRGMMRKYMVTVQVGRHARNTSTLWGKLLLRALCETCYANVYSRKNRYNMLRWRGNYSDYKRSGAIGVCGIT